MKCVRRDAIADAVQSPGGCVTMTGGRLVTASAGDWVLTWPNGLVTIVSNGRFMADFRGIAPVDGD